MKKFLTLIALLLSVTFMMNSQAFNESVAGSLSVSGQRVGVLIVDLQSYTYPLRWGAKVVSPADNYFSIGIKAELINKGASVMVLNPPGMEKQVAPFLAVGKKGQFNGREELANNITTITQSALGTHSKKVLDSQTHPEGMKLVEKLMSATEFSGELDRVDQFTSFYKKVLDLWNINKLITIEVKSRYSYIIRGYDINGASAGLVFQYYLKTDKDMFGKIETSVGSGDVKENGFTILDGAKVKPESSDKRIYEVIKRVGSFFK